MKNRNDVFAIPIYGNGYELFNLGFEAVDEQSQALLDALADGSIEPKPQDKQEIRLYLKDGWSTREINTEDENRKVFWLLDKDEPVFFIERNLAEGTQGFYAL